MPAPSFCYQALQPAELTCEQKEQDEPDEAAKKDELFERIDIEYGLGTQVEAETTHHSEQYQSDRTPDRRVMSFLNHG